RVRVEGRLHAGVDRTARGALDPIGGAAELVGRQGGLPGSVRAPGCSEPRLVLVARQDDRAASAGGGKRRDRLVEGSKVVAEAVPVGDAKRREGADELEAVAREPVGDFLGVVAEVAGRAELDPGVAEPAHGLEHPVRRDEVVAADRPLPDTPRAGRTREALHGATLRQASRSDW